LRNALTIDLESVSHRYMAEERHRSGTGRRVRTEISGKSSDRGEVLQTTREILNALREHDHRITFFIVGEIYDWYPDLVREIRELGHEIAYHTHSHTRIDDASTLASELRKSSEFITTFKPMGFRAPRASITLECLSELAKHGFVYDSSSYGSLSWYAETARIIEVPISTYSLLRNVRTSLPRPLSLKLLMDFEVPFGSGYFISLFSLASPATLGYFINKLNRKGISSVLCLHPWQLCRKQMKPFSNAVLPRLLMLPYDRSCFRAFAYLLRNYKLCTMSELIENTGLL